jgi:precorrin-3B synthase
MTSAAVTLPQRRGACPGLSAPMTTGDGLLVRLTPIGTISLDALAALCAAAQRQGNGIIEITARGNIQVRGLNAASTQSFAESVGALDIAADDGVPILGNPLAGLDPEEVIDAGALAADLRKALARSSMAAKLSPKVSVAIDGGTLTLDRISADVRLRAEATNAGVMLRVAMAGDGANAAEIGLVALVDGVAAATRLLDVIAAHGREARARDVVAADGINAFSSAIADLLIGNGPSRPIRETADVIGAHRLRDGLFACGIGLAFGHADALSLQRLAEAARTSGASGLRAAPGRSLMAIGLASEQIASFATTADRLGFIVRADDPRRHVVACAGAPICASARIAARAIGPLIAASAAPYLDGSFKIHISGCTKGCAHPARAALTVVGTEPGCALVANGSSRDTPFTVVAESELVAAVTDIARDLQNEAGNV